jgi:hypothetical protein
MAVTGERASFASEEVLKIYLVVLRVPVMVTCRLVSLQASGSSGGAVTSLYGILSGTLGGRTYWSTVERCYTLSRGPPVGIGLVGGGA